MHIFRCLAHTAAAVAAGVVSFSVIFLGFLCGFHSDVPDFTTQPHWFFSVAHLIIRYSSWFCCSFFCLSLFRYSIPFFTSMLSRASCCFILCNICESANIFRFILDHKVFEFWITEPTRTARICSRIMKTRESNDEKYEPTLSRTFYDLLFRMGKRSWFLIAIQL